MDTSSLYKSGTSSSLNTSSADDQFLTASSNVSGGTTPMDVSQSDSFTNFTDASSNHKQSFDLLVDFDAANTGSTSTMVQTPQADTNPFASPLVDFEKPSETRPELFGAAITPANPPLSQDLHDFLQPAFTDFALAADQPQQKDPTDATSIITLTPDNFLQPLKTESETKQSELDLVQIASLKVEEIPLKSDADKNDDKKTTDQTQTTTIAASTGVTLVETPADHGNDALVTAENKPDETKKALPESNSGTVQDFSNIEAAKKGADVTQSAAPPPPPNRSNSSDTIPDTTDATSNTKKTSFFYTNCCNLL